MAYAALMTLSKAIDLILPQDHEYTFLCEKEQMQSLQHKVICLQEFLEHVSRRPSSRKPLEVMEGRIRETTYQLEDIVESIIVGSFQEDVLASRCGTSAASIPVQKASDDTLVDRTIAAFTSCIEKVDVLIKDSMEMKEALNSNFISKTIFSGTKECSSSEPPATNTNVGLEDDFIQILDRITSDVSSLQIISITGMGGIGKTTLARAVYEHPGLQSHFDLRIWVTVSQEWNIQEILQGLLAQNGAQNDDVVSLSLRVHKKLYGRRYLVVLDDVWDEDAWDGVRIAFPNGNEKSRVILTTRLLELGRYVDSSGQLHEKKFLSHEQSWNLLREKVEDCPVELANIGRTISTNCKGLPLAVVVIGGLLKFNKTKNYWEEVAQLTTVRASMGDEYLLEILSLSYTNLPPHLKACFLYFGMFREDKEIPTDVLVRLWSAEGFLKPRESKTIEAVAEECLEELVERSLVLVKERRYNGKIETSSIHDVLRDFCLRESEKENFLHYCTSKHIDPATYGKIMKEQRRVSFSTWVEQRMWQFRSYYTTDETLVRSFIHDVDDYSEKVPSISFIDLKLLWVLRVRSPINYPLSILCSRLTNLRYLELKVEDGQQTFPKSISKLRNLETFIIFTNDRLVEFIILPLEIWMMPRVRHLIYNNWGGGITFPEPSLNGTSLESLQTLFGIINQCFTMSVINKMLNLRSLNIEYEQKEDANQCGLDNLVHLHILQHLSIYGGPGLTNFVFPQKLKELSLCETKIPWEKMVSIGELPHLEWLELRWSAFVGQVWEPSEGGFCQLKYLIMFRLDLEEWRAESTHFPSLEELSIEYCEKLKEVPAEIGEIDTLKKLTVYTGWLNKLAIHTGTINKSIGESVERIKDEQELNGNDSLQVIFERR